MYLTPEEGLLAAIPFVIVAAFLAFRLMKRPVEWRTDLQPFYCCVVIGLALTSKGTLTSTTTGLWWHTASLWTQALGLGWLLGLAAKDYKLTKAKP